MGTVEQTIIIEELSRNYKVLARHKYAQDNIAVGRSYDSDIIISDPHVCPEHINLSFNGENWQIKDLDTVNGSFLGDKKKSADQHIINSGDIITLGNSQIRFIFPNHPVEQSILFSPFESLINFTKKPAVLITSILIFACLAAHLNYLNHTKEVTFTQLLVPTISMVLAFALWPCGVALVSHLTKNESRVWHQLGVSFVIINIFWLTDFIESILLFNLPSNVLISIVVMALPMILAFCLFWLNAYIGFHMTNKRRNIVAAGLVVLFFGGPSIIQMSKQPDFRAAPSYNNILMPPAFLFTATNSSDSFIKESELLFAKALKDANKED